MKRKLFYFFVVFIVGIFVSSCTMVDTGGELITEDCPDGTNQLFIKATQPYNENDLDKYSLQITRLEKEKVGDDELKIRIYGHVVSDDGQLITGLNMAEYKKYWCKVEDSSIVKLIKPKKFDIFENYEKIREPMALVLVLDHSGSMGQYRARKMQEAVSRFIEKYFNKDDKISIVKYDNNIMTLDVPEPANKAEWEKFKKNFEVGLYNFGGLTAMKDGIGKGLEILTSNEFKKYRLKYLLAITDGFENSSVKYTTEKIVETALDNKINISTVAFGDYVDKVLLADSIAQTTFGSYYYICNTKDFDFLFEDAYLRFANNYIIEYRTPIFYGLHAVNVALCLPGKELSAKNYYFVEPPKVDEVLQIRNIYFDFDKATIKKDSSKEAIDKIYYLMAAYPGINISIVGHTDSSGTDKYNDDLSLRRANSVKTEVNKMGIANSRMDTKGMGRRKPVVVENKKEENRALNRRVEIIIHGEIEKEIVKRQNQRFLTPAQSSRR